MIRQLLLIFLLFLSLPALAQTELPKDEARKYLLKEKVQEYDYRNYYDSIVLAFVDGLKQQGIDTLGIYGQELVGYISLDSCDSERSPWRATVQWVDKGRTYSKMIRNNCEYNTQEIGSSALIRYYINSFPNMERIRIMPVYTALQRDKKGSLIEVFNLIDHTVHHYLYCTVGNRSIFRRFEDSDLTHKGSLFHEYNNRSIIKSWYDLIKNQLEEIDGE